MQKISIEGVHGETQLGQQDDPFGNLQDIEILPY